jgi:hypothetical protein
MQIDFDSMPKIDAFGIDGNALSGEVVCPKCNHPSLYHKEMPRWSSIHDDDMSCLRPLTILFCCSVCESIFGLQVITHKDTSALSWIEISVLGGSGDA